MSKHFKRTRKGRPRKSGDRYSNGRLKPVDPRNMRVAEIRSAFCDDLTKASCPLDVAMANGWMNEADYRAAMSYVAAFRGAKMGAPGCTTAVDLSTPSSALDVRGLQFRDMASADVAAAFDSAMGSGRGLSGDDDGSAGALATWRRMNAGMSPAARGELQLVAIFDSWPQWINIRVLKRNLLKRIEAEKRKATTEEAEKIKAWTLSPWEHKRDLLLEACAHVRRMMRSDRIISAPVKDGEIVPVPGPKVAETINYVDATGETVLEVVKIRRKGAA